MSAVDFVIVGAGAAGEAAAHLARARGASVVIVERDLFGGSCAFWACMPSKTLLHAADVHRWGDRYPWSRASARRDYMIVREDRDYPDDAGHAKSLEQAGARIIRGSARLAGPGRVDVRRRDGREESLEARHVIVAVGSGPKIPELDGIETIRTWTNREATSARELPGSLLILGGGPTGVELAQAYARYGVPVTIVESNRRILARDHPRNSEAVRKGLERDGVTVRTGVRAVRARGGAGTDGADRVELDDGSAVEGHVTLLAIGRSFPLEGLGLETVGLDAGHLVPDGRLRLADGLWLIGDPAGPELHTHLSHYQGEMAVRMALGDEATPDYTAIPRCTYTDPEAAFTGLALEQAEERGVDAAEFTELMATTAKGYVTETELGHVSIVVDRSARTLVGAAIAGPPGSSEAIHEAVLAVKAHLPIDLLADTIHAFPTTARVLGSLFVRASRELPR